MARTSLDSLLYYLRRLGPDKSDTAEDSDTHLLRRFATQNDEAAFAALVRRHGAMVWSVCSRLLPQAADAEDAFQAAFLILVRKAHTLRKPDLLGPWLYGVARRVADKVRRAADRRRARERTLIDPPVCEPTSDVVWRDLRPLLDEEVGRLPEKYRVPFVLCCLEGMTNEEAANRLRCPMGTVLSRLSRARERLRGRLVRRGVDLTGATLATAVAAHATSAAPPAVVAETVRMGLTYAAGPAAQAGPVVVLAEGVLHSMFTTKVKMAVIVLLALGVLSSGVGMFARFGPTETGTPARAAEKGAPEKVPPADKGVEAKDAAAAPAPPVTAAGTAAHQALNRDFDFHGLDDPKTTVADALEAFSKILQDRFRVNVNIDVNEKAFAADNVPGVLAYEIAKEQPIPPMKASLGAILRKVLSRIPAESGAVVMIRKAGLEITTQRAVRAELGIPDNRPLPPLVYADFEDKPLPAALRALADASDFTIVFDRQAVGDKCPKVTADFHNVPVDTAVKVLAETADLGCVRLDNVFFVTTREKAARLQAEGAPPKGPEKPAEPKPAPEPKKESPKPSP